MNHLLAEPGYSEVGGRENVSLSWEGEAGPSERLGRERGRAQVEAGPRERLGRGRGWAQGEAGPRERLGPGRGWAQVEAGPGERPGPGRGRHEDGGRIPTGPRGREREGG